MFQRCCDLYQQSPPELGKRNDFSEKRVVDESNTPLFGHFSPRILLSPQIFHFKFHYCRLTHHENIIRRWELATSLYEMQQIKKLTVNISANL